MKKFIPNKKIKFEFTHTNNFTTLLFYALNFKPIMIVSGNKAKFLFPSFQQRIVFFGGETLKSQNTQI